MRGNRASEKRRDVSGGREGSGEGKGEGDGGGEEKKGGATDEGGGKGFAFGRPPDKDRVASTTSKGATPSVRSGEPHLSYRDKLMAPGYAGFLVQHAEGDDIVKGWRDYFHQMNEKDSSRDPKAADDEETQSQGRMNGESGVLQFTADEYTTWCLPWMNLLIIKVLGASFPTFLIQDRIQRMWRTKDPWKFVPLNNGYYIVSFSKKGGQGLCSPRGPLDDRGSLSDRTKVAAELQSMES
ncbi:hypothetical protein K1719_031066 [Acacia pycnantha]|nr:hypothetical protein K1719_031066 [Acacia pycnantha]